jgi:Cys-Gly metallodipeptidase DUG1
MTDLISLMSRLVDSAGNILVPGVDDMVQAAGMEERWVFLSSLLLFYIFFGGSLVG